MEALIVAAFTLLAIVLLEAGYWIAMSLVRWAPIVAAATLAGWLAHRLGAERLEALGVAALAFLLARHLLRRRWHDHYDDGLL